MADLALARKVLETEAAAILALVARLDGEFDRAVELLQRCRGRVILTGMGKSGIICQKIAATLSSTGTPRSFFIRPKRFTATRRHPERRRGGGAVVQRRDRRDPAAARDDSAARRQTDRHHRRAESTLAQAADVALDCSVIEEACPLNLVPDGQHDGGAGARRRARHDAAGREGIPAGGFRQPASRRQDRETADAGREPDARRQAVPDRRAPTRRMRDVIYEMSSKALGMTCVVDGDGRRCSGSSPTAICGATWTRRRASWS